MYGPEYVNRLYGMISRNITPPFKLFCFTDDRVGIRQEVICCDLPELGCPLPSKAPGKWRKTSLWGHTLFDLQGVALFLDLDVVITGSLDELFSYGSPDDVILARNWIKPLERLGQTSVFRYPIGKHGYMLDRFREDPEGIGNKYQFEQRYVTQCVAGGVKFFPSTWVKHFRLNCLGPWPMRYLRPAKLPKKARIVIFPGNPGPKDAALGRWSERHLPSSPLQHLKGIFSKNRVMKLKLYIKRYLLPVPWVQDHWRE